MNEMKTGELKLPSFSDLNNDEVTISFVNMPSFMSYDASANKILINNPIPGEYFFTIVLQDSQKAKTLNMQKITIVAELQQETEKEQQKETPP